MGVREKKKKGTCIILVECTNFIVMTVMVMIKTKDGFGLYNLPLIGILLPNFRLQV
jgi:hypothetical protein